MLGLQRPGMCAPYLPHRTSVWDSHCDPISLGSPRGGVSGGMTGLELVLGMEEGDLDAGLGSCSFLQS